MDRLFDEGVCKCSVGGHETKNLHIYRSCIHFSIGTDGQCRFTDGELVYHLYRPYRWTRFLGATLCPCNNANDLIHERILHIYRSCIHFSIRTDGQLRFTDGQLVYHRYRPYRWTRFLGATLCPCNNANYLIHDRSLHIYRSCIHFSIGTDGQLRFTDGKLVYHLYRPYRWTRFLGATLCPCNNANYFIHDRILCIYRSCIHFSIRTDGQLRFSDGQLVYHLYRPYRWTRFLGLPYALAIMLTTSFTIGFCAFTDRVFISPSVPTDNFDLPMDNWFTIGTDRTDGQGFWGLPYALAIMLTTSFTKGFCTFTDLVFISPSVPTDNFDLPMDNWFTIGTDRTDGQGFWGLPYALAIMLTTSFTKGFCTFTDRVFISPSVPTDNFDLPMENWFTICTDRTDGQGFWGIPYALAIMLTTSFTIGFCAFTDRVFISPSVPADNFDLAIDGQLVYHLYRPYRWTRFLGLPYALAIMLTTSFTKGFCTFTDRVFISPSVPTDNFDLAIDGQLVYHRYRPYRWTRFLGLPYALAIMLTTSFTKGFCTFTDRVFISPSVPTDNFDLPMDNWFTIGTDRTDGQGFWGLPYALAITLTTSFTKGFCTFTDRVFISPSVPTDNFDLQMDNWFTIGTDRTDGQGFWGLPYVLAIMLTTSFTKGFCTFTDRVFISPSVPTDNFDLPMDNWFTIGTDRTDGQDF